MDKTNAPVRARIVDLLKSGLSDKEILEEVWGGKRLNGSSNMSQCRHAICLARRDLEIEQEGGPTIKWRGPWPVSYVRSNGEVVYRVAPGHDVPEGSLKALGFRR